MAALGWLLNLGFGGSQQIAPELPFWTPLSDQTTAWAAFPAASEETVSAEQQRLALLRASAGGILPITLPSPDGDVSAADRAHLLGLVPQGGAVASPDTVWTEVERHDP